jgi:hypothetical protein
MTKIARAHPVRRVLRALDLFTLVTMNPTSPYNTPYTGQISRVVSGQRVL